MILYAETPQTVDVTRTLQILLTARQQLFADQEWKAWNTVRRAMHHVQNTDRFQPAAKRKPISKVFRLRIPVAGVAVRM